MAEVRPRNSTQARKAFETARSMVESSLDSLAAISPDGRITNVNEASANATGILHEELIGTAFSRDRARCVRRGPGSTRGVRSCIRVRSEQEGVEASKCMNLDRWKLRLS